MPCYKPLRACVVKCPGGRSISFRMSAVGQGISLPCGRCIGCRLERARQWAVRLLHESKLHEENSFLTLTYDDKFLPKDGSLVKEHCQLFMKRLRKRLSPLKIKFFLCGEYGEKLLRPHYHAIIFGYGFPDKVLLKKVGDVELFTSVLLSEVWGLGFCTIGAVTFDSACYVANYATKKITGKSAKAFYGSRCPEFLLMSRGGRAGRGIGYGWFELFESDVFPADEVIVNGKEARPPRYYDNIISARAKLEFPPGKWTALRDSLKSRRESEALELEKELSVGRVSYKKAQALLKEGFYPSDSRLLKLRVREDVVKAKALLKSRRLEK